MFESGTGPGVRSDRFGTWSLITFLLLFLPIFGYITPVPLGPLVWLPAVACAATTLAAIGCGLAGVFSRMREQRRAALHGLLKAAVPTVVGGSFILLLVALSTMNIE
jgi:hypothetical protein